MYIYKITNTINGKVYVGLDSRSASAKIRWSEHKTASRSLSPINAKKVLYRAMRKYGIVNFSFEVIDECQSHTQLFIKERYWIAYYDSLCPIGYNRTPGGESPWARLPDEEIKIIRQKMSFGMKRFWLSLDAAQRRCQVEAVGRSVRLWWSSLDANTLRDERQSRSLHMKRRWALLSDEERNDVCANNGLRKWWAGLSPQEMLLHVTKRQKGHRCWWATLSEYDKTAHVHRASAASVLKCAKDYEVETPTGDVRHIKNLSKLCKENDLTQANMLAVARGRQSHHKGWKCWLLDDHGNRVPAKRATHFQRSRSWIFSNPMKHEVNITNLKAYCLDHELSYKAMRKVALGQQNAYCGWTIIERK